MKYIKIIKKYVINTMIIFVLFFCSMIMGFNIPNKDGITFSDYNNSKINVEEKEVILKDKNSKLEGTINNIKALNNEIEILNNDIALEEE